VQTERDYDEFRHSIRQLAARHVTPIADEIDRTDQYPFAVQRVMAEAGLVQLAVPFEFGGAGGDVTSVCIAREEVARAGSMALATLAGQSGAVTLPLLGLGTREQQEYFLPEIAKGCVASVSLTEPHAGSDLAALSTRATRSPSGWLLNGEKSFLTWGKIARFCLVFARSNDEPGTKGISAFLIETDDPGFVETRRNHKMGQRGLPNCDIRLTDVRAGELSLIGGDGGGLNVALHGLHRNRPMLAAIALGGAEAALDYAIAFLKQRTVKGKPLSSLQGLRWMIADLATSIEASRLLIYDVARRLDSGEPVDNLAMLAAMAKYYATETAVRVAGEAIQLLGGAGYMQDHPVERYLRDVKVTTIYEGTSQIQKNTIARALLDI
jgi:alkylation response protein AidB-like acyl-CoA dehydrogenase